MNHYPHHIGDFNSATMHLTFVERALYREMLDLYYDSETPLNPDVAKLARRLRANTDELRDALNILLDEFFVKRDDGWHNARCDAEIAAYRQKQEQQRKAGQASAAARSGRGAKSSKSTAGSTGVGSRGVHGVDGVGADVERPFNESSTNQNQNQNQNQLIPPIPPTGGAVVSTDEHCTESKQPEQPINRMGNPAATVSQLMGYFPEHRRIRSIEVGRKVVELVEGGVVTEGALLTAAAAQSKLLCKDDGKACPSVLRWLKESRWKDAAAIVTGGVTGVAGASSNWRESRSGIEQMGVLLGMEQWDQERERLFSMYEARVVDTYNAQVGVAEA